MTSRSWGAAALAVLVCLGGCAVQSKKSLKEGQLAALQPLDVKLGVLRPELSAQFEVSTAGVAGAAACGAIPGIGILLAAACGAAAGSIDASVNAERAKTAEQTILPLKNAVADLDFESLARANVSDGLTTLPSVKVAGVTRVMGVSPAIYEQEFKASTASTVMFITFDYHLTKNFDTFEVTARTHVFPRTPQARAAVAVPEIPAGSTVSQVATQYAAYNSDIVYSFKLPKPGADNAANVALWQADNGRLLRAAETDGLRQLTAFLMEDLKRVGDLVLSNPNRQVDVSPGVKAQFVARSDDGEMLRLANGTFLFNADLTRAVQRYEASLPANNKLASVTAPTPDKPATGPTVDVK